MRDATMTVWRRLLERTVWGESYTFEDAPPRYKSLYTVALPLQYLLFTLYGMTGALTIVPSVEQLLGSDYSDLWTILVGVNGLVVLLALVFRGHWVELIATVVLVVGMFSYPASLAVFAFILHDPNKAALAVGLPALLILPAWRVSDLVKLIRKRRARLKGATL